MIEDILYSYHIFYFPFKWEIKDLKNDFFSRRVDLDNIKVKEDSQWRNIKMPLNDEYLVELYNERNFFYDFVGNVLYDTNNSNNIIRHYERSEAYKNELSYEIKVVANGKESLYKLKLKSIVLNLYSTGTGILIFYIENNKYQDFSDVLRINQFGRRVFPPFLGVRSGVSETKKYELADYISINGLNGPAQRYYDDFIDYTSSSQVWKESHIIKNLVSDLDDRLDIAPVVDDRMFVVSWYGNDDYEKLIKGGEIVGEKIDDWYKYLFIDGGDSPTCQNQKMKENLIAKHSYLRWEEWGSIYGISRYSMVFLSGNNQYVKSGLLSYFRTIYARMIELCLIQRASLLKFSGEVTLLSRLKDERSGILANRISDFYKEYIRFVNQIYFREITTQEQGIELYEMMKESMKIEKQVEDLDNEIGELHQYAVLLEENRRTVSLSILSVIGAIFIAPTFITGFMGMNLIDLECLNQTPMMWLILILGIIFTPIFILLFIRTSDKKPRYIFLFLAFLILVFTILTPTLIF